MDVDANSGKLIGVSWWLFFQGGAAAQACAEELERAGFLALAEHRPDIVHREEKWLVRAARPFAPGTFKQERQTVNAIVRAHGGINEGADSGWMYGAGQLMLYLAETA